MPFNEINKETNAIYGAPLQEPQIKKAKTAVLGVIEQSIGVYQLPSFRDLVTTLWGDPLLVESVMMFAQQVVATGFFLTGNSEYQKKDGKGRTALDVIKKWCDNNNIDIKVFEIALELRAFGNCIAKGSRVCLGSGETKPIENMLVGDLVYSIDDCGNFVKNKVLEVINNGIKEIYELSTNTRKLMLTDNHPLLTPNGWKQLSSLSIGDEIAVIDGYSGASTEDKNLVRLLGAYTGDGYTTLHSLPFKNSKKLYESGAVVLCIFNPEEVAFYKNIMKELTGKEAIFKEGSGLFLHSVDFVNKIRSLGVCGKSYNKRVPTWIYSLSEELREEYLLGYTDTDGYVDKFGDYRYEANNENLIRDMRDLAISLGKRVSNVYHRERDWKITNQVNKTYEGKSISWAFVIFNHKNKGKGKTASYRTVNGIKYDKIKKIEAVGTEEVYDLHIENTHNFVADGVVVHNSVWRLNNDLGFVKVPIEAIWHMIKVSDTEPLQEKYHIELTPYYNQVILKYGEYFHFRSFITGYKAPLGMGLLQPLLTQPVDSNGTVAPSVYDMRLSRRTSLDEGFRKFSFPNVWVGLPELSNEDFESQGIAAQAASMSTTGNRIVTNSKVEIALEVPERTQSYDSFITAMDNEFFMGLADPSLKLGLEEGFTKSTAETANAVYQFKISTMRRTIKQHFEDFFKQILDKQGFDGNLAEIKMNFGPEEKAEYNIADIFAGVQNKVLSKKSARYLLATYHKWDINLAEIEKELDEEQQEQEEIMNRQMTLQASLAPKGTDGTEKTKPKGTSNEIGADPKKAEKKQKEEEVNLEAITAPFTNSEPSVAVTELKSDISGISKDGKTVYIDPIARDFPRELLIARETYKYPLITKLSMPYSRASKLALIHEKAVSYKMGLEWGNLEKLQVDLQNKHKNRNLEKEVFNPINILGED